MQTTNNTILITGGGSGIGRALAESFHKLGNQVIISGRRQEVLDEVARANPGMKSRCVDMADPDNIRSFAAQIAGEYPALNVLFNNAGMMKTENLREAAVDHLADAEATITTNLLGPIRLTAHLLPLLRRQPRAAIVNTTSGLAFVPLAMSPAYSATKSALHSYTQSLRYQLRGTAVQVIELIPPYVATSLTGERQARDPMAMPLANYITEVMSLFEAYPDATEINVQRVLPLRYAAESGREKYDAFVTEFNDKMIAARQ